MHRIALAVLGNREEAEEAAQDVFVRVHRGLASYRGEVSFRAWVHRVALNTSISTYRRGRRRRRTERSTDPVELAEVVSGNPGNPETQAANHEVEQKVRQMVRRLPRKLCEAVILHYLQEMRLEEIGEVLGIPIGTVKSRLYLARQRLVKEAEREGLVELTTPAKHGRHSEGAARVCGGSGIPAEDTAG